MTQKQIPLTKLPLISRKAKQTAATAKVLPAAPGSDDKYRSFIENLPVLFYAVEAKPPYTPIYISPAFERFGYSLEEWRTDPDMWLRVIHEEDRDWVFQATQASTRTGKAADYEFRIVAIDGSIHWMRDRGCLIKDKNNKVLLREGVMLDITDRKLAQQELQKREKLYRTLAHNIPRTAVLLFDRDFRYTLADGEQLARHNYTQEMFEGKTLWELFPPDVAKEYADYYQRALDGEKTNFEQENEEGCFQVHVMPVRDENDEIFAGMVMWQDITDRKNAEKESRESEARYRNLFENANDIIYVHDLDGNYISINQAAEKVLGFSREEALSMNMAQIAAPEHLRRIRTNLAKKLTGKAKQTAYEIDCIRKDGSRLTLEVNSSAICKDGVAVGVQGIARDITERKRSEQALRESEGKFRTVAETASDAIIAIDEECRIIFANAATEAIFGYSINAMLGQDLGMLLPDRMKSQASGMARFMHTDERGSLSKSVQLPGMHQNGREMSLELSFAEYIKEGRRYFTSIIRDVTERRQTEEALQASERRYRDLFENANDLIYTHDLAGNFTSINRAGEIITGYSRDEAMTMNVSKVVAPEFLQTAASMTARKIAGEQTSAYDLEIISKDGNRVSLELSTRIIYQDERPIGVQGIGRDITERKRAQEQLHYYARHDTLTDLPNRSEFMTQLKQSIERTDGGRNGRLAVLFLDLDRFKIVNDSLGHAVGDKLLIAIAKRLKGCIRPGDVVARLGGDEFTILLNRTGDSIDVVRVAERLQFKLSEPFMIDNYEVFTTASIGIVVADGITREPEEYLRDADAAMYRAKETGKARYEIFDSEMHVQNMNLLQVENDLRHAVERGEFEVFYQPVVALVGRAVREFEALIRWRHPTHGLVGPDEFISVAEETGLIIPIGRWILEESCRQIAEWQKRTSFPLSISVNLSAKQLMHPSLTAEVRQILNKTGISARQLKLEVTESTVMENSEKALLVLTELDAMGVSLSTDDFGTGYSSLSYLQRFPFNRLKIDRSFIDKMDKDEKSGSIVKTILMLGENLGIEVVAEGVETERQLKMLRELDCRMGQGFLFSRPVEAAEAEKLLTPFHAIENQMPNATFGPASEIFEVAKLQ